MESRKVTGGEETGWRRNQEKTAIKDIKSNREGKNRTDETTGEKTVKNRWMASVLILCLAASLCVGCARSGKEHKKEKARKEAEEDLKEYDQDYSKLELDSTKWNYDKKKRVYWQTVVYCTDPAAEAYEAMAVYVPKKYMDGTENEDGTYTCTVNAEREVGGYRADTAPIVFPVNSVEYEGYQAPVSCDDGEISHYVKAGYIYVSAGIRGSETGAYPGSQNYEKGAPWGVTDLKAAVRYYRYNQDLLPGDAEQIYCLGIGGGGTLAAVLGASGDSDLYTPYLTEIGAAMHDREGEKISDAIAGVMVWRPAAGLDYASEAYEWNIGQYLDTDTRAEGTWTRQFSEDMADMYAEYLNALELKDGQGKKLTLKKSEDGIYTKGSYYKYLVSVIENALSRYLADMEEGAAKEYVNLLNSGETWVSCDAASHTVKVTGMEAFVKYCGSGFRGVGAFDDINRSRPENALFGTKNLTSLHFDATMNFLLSEYGFEYGRLENWDDAIANEYSADMEAEDSLDNSVSVRLSMYNPMYYISPYYEGYGTGKLAKHWQINTGIGREDTLLTAEVNLALALEAAKGVGDVQFEAVWEPGQTGEVDRESVSGIFSDWVSELTARSDR